MTTPQLLARALTCLVALVLVTMHTTGAVYMFLSLLCILYMMDITRPTYPTRTKEL